MSELDKLIGRYNDELEELSRKVSELATRIPCYILTTVSRDELKQQYLQVSKIRGELRNIKSVIDNTASQITEKIGKLSYSNAEGKDFMEYIVEGTVASWFGEDPKSFDRKNYGRAKRKLESIAREYKKLAITVDPHTKQIDQLLEPLNNQLEWHEKTNWVETGVNVAKTALVVGVAAWLNSKGRKS